MPKLNITEPENEKKFRIFPVRRFKAIDATVPVPLTYRNQHQKYLDNLSPVAPKNVAIKTIYHSQRNSGLVLAPQPV